MIVYNVTIKVDLSIHDTWLEWMQSKHIPDVMATGYFVEYKMFRIMSDDERDGISYSIQYFCESFADYSSYQENSAPLLQKEHTEKYEGKFVAFRTILRQLDYSE